jgi:predicted dithiol-disulfide oxidoreductase (DUF899 family)
MSTNKTEYPSVVSREVWLKDRKTLLAKEKEFSRLGDQLSIGI